MGLISKSNTFSAGNTIQASEHNTNFDTVYTLVNGNIEDANVKSTANIQESKILFATGGHDHSGGAKGKQVTISSLSITSQNTGDLIYYTGTAWARFGTGANNTVLMTTSGTILWV